MDIAFLKSAFITLFVAIDPPGLATIFLGLTASMSAISRKKTAYQAVIIAFCILAAAALGGQALLNALSISIPAFKIAGGLLLFYIAAEMVFEHRTPRKNEAAETTIVEDAPHNIAAFPLAIPLMAGPGAITATILLASNTHGNIVDLIALIVIIGVIIGSCLLTFLMAEPINRLLGVTGRVVLSRLLGVLLAAMAVQIVGDGVLAFS
ncbi:MAG: MarC family protein [Rickettsiales bacterium]